MATDRTWRCSTCSSRRGAGSLFDALRLVAESELPICRNCGRPEELHLGFDFGLDAVGKEQVVKAAFMPRRPENWTDQQGRHVTFWPFLVITQREGRRLAVWLPYWHIVRQEERRISKYGQWAPFMDDRHFTDLLAQARAAGYFDVRESPSAI